MVGVGLWVGFLPVFGLVFGTMVQFGRDDGPVLLDATKAFQDLAERYVTSNDETKVESS